MNATQASHLLKSATQALALMNPDWIVAHQLRQAIDAAREPAPRPTGKPSKRKGGASYKPFTAEECTVPHVFQGTIDKDGQIAHRNDIRDTACLCAGCRIVRGFYERGFGEHKQNIAEGSDFDKSEIMKRLIYCACGHLTDNHAKDEMESLLNCSSCDCDHFHYEESEAA